MYLSLSLHLFCYILKLIDSGALCVSKNPKIITTNRIGIVAFAAWRLGLFRNFSIFYWFKLLWIDNTHTHSHKHILFDFSLALALSVIWIVVYYGFEYHFFTLALQTIGWYGSLHSLQWMFEKERKKKFFFWKQINGFSDSEIYWKPLTNLLSNFD